MMLGLELNLGTLNHRNVYSLCNSNTHIELLSVHFDIIVPSNAQSKFLLLSINKFYSKFGPESE